MLKRRISMIIFALIICLSSAGAAFADWLKYADNAEELQGALDDGAENIVITSSIKGNFSVPRWVKSIRGSYETAITITPADESKPVFTIESAASRRTSIFTSTAESLNISDLIIICAGECSGIDANSTTKPVTISDVTFKGINAASSKEGCKPSTITTFTGCTFENLTWGVYALDSGAKYDIKIKGCTFKNISQALAMNKTSPKAKAAIENCKGENVAYWVIRHSAGEDVMYVTVDQSTIDSCAGSNYYHKVTDALNNNNAYNSKQFNTLIEDVERAFKALPEGAKSIIREQSKGWDDIRIYSMTELGRKLRAIDFSGDDKKAIDECLELYALLASAPVASIFRIDGSIVPLLFFVLSGKETISGIISDKNLVMPMVYSFINSTELAPLTKIDARISWGSTGNVRDALCRVSQNPDRIFRENLHRLQDWLSAIDEARKNLQELKSMAGRHYDYSYVAEMEKTLRAVYDFGIAVNRFSAAIFFDLPVDVLFAVNYAKVTAESNQSRIIGICRELGSVYSVSQRLCVLNRTQTMRNELLKLWKEKLVEGWIGKDYSKYDELVQSLATDPDLMRDAERVKDFFREWR